MAVAEVIGVFKYMASGFIYSFILQISTSARKELTGVSYQSPIVLILQARTDANH